MTRRIPTLAALLAALVLLAHTGTATALTPSQIESGARRASSGVDTITTALASDAFQGRNNQTEGSEIARSYLIPLLREIGPGVNGGTTDADYEHPFAAGTNLIAVIRGRELPDEYVVLGAHYDHLGMTATDVFNGATDNAAGSAEAVAVGRAIAALPEAPRRSIVIALWDAEEDGLLGSIAYVSDPPVPLASTVGYVNLDIQASNLTPSLARTSFAISAETGGARLQEIAADAIRAEAHAYPEHVDTVELSYIFGQLRSDYASFVAAEVPTVFFTDATGGCYHTVDDETQFADFDKLASQSRITYRTVVTLAESDSLPSFVPANPALATYADAVILNTVLKRGRPDLALFTPTDRRHLIEVLAGVQGVVDRGEASFGADDVAILLQAALDTLAAIDSSLGCAGYFPPRGRGRGPARVPGDGGLGTRRPVGDRGQLPHR